MSTLVHPHREAARRIQQKRRKGHNPLAAPVAVCAIVCAVAVAYVGYTLWPRWPDAPVAMDAPSLPVNIAGVPFNIEPAAIRIPLQRRAGALNRVDLAYLWPSLVPPDPSVKIVDGVPVDPNERLFATIQVSDGTMPLNERVQTIYPRYLGTDVKTGDDGLTTKPFKNGTPYQGEDLIMDASAPDKFMARCSRKGVTNSGTCLMERRVGGAEITLRFPREWLSDWRGVASGIDKLMSRWRPSI